MPETNTQLDSNVPMPSGKKGKTMNDLHIPRNEEPRILYKTDPSCNRCKTDPYVPHYNCMYSGRAVGHSSAHCTANACY